MIERTFLHLPRTGVATEQKLWRSGVRNWAAFVATERIKGLSQEKKTTCDNLILASTKALATGDNLFFLRLEQKHHWRLYPSFADEAVYVDIETSWHGDVTVLGIYDGMTVKQFIKGINLTPNAVRDHLRGKIIVTYNGASFDLPVLRRVFGNAVPQTLHFDTMHLARKLGYRGGLKALEVSLGLRRPEHIEGMSGQDALHLWELYKASGNEAYLKRLLAYNEEDIVNLVTVAKKLVIEAEQAFLNY